MTPRFDPTRAMVFDLAHGKLRDDEANERLNVPVLLMRQLLESAGDEATAQFARNLGHEVGRRAQGRLGEEGAQAGIGAWTEHLGGQLALLGWGDLSVEQWGRALVLVIDGAPDRMEHLSGILLEEALRRALSRDVDLVPFDDAGKLAYLALSKPGAQRARNLKDEGAGLGQVIEKLHQGAG